MRIKSAEPNTKQTIRQILEKFLPVHDHWSKPRFTEIFSAACDEFDLGCLEPADFGLKLTEHSDIAMRDKDHYVVLEPPEHQQFLPFVTLDSSDNWIHFRVYVLLAGLDENSKVQGVAFRYETDEGDGRGKHDYCHAQMCRSIRRGGRAVSPFWMLESDPAIPMEADNQIGLVLCMLTSIYGRQRVLGKFDRTDGQVWEQMKNIRALRPNQQE